MSKLKQKSPAFKILHMNKHSKNSVNTRSGNGVVFTSTNNNINYFNNAGEESNLQKENQNKIMVYINLDPSMIPAYFVATV